MQVLGLFPLWLTVFFFYATNTRPPLCPSTSRVFLSLSGDMHNNAVGFLCLNTIYFEYLIKEFFTCHITLPRNQNTVLVMAANTTTGDNEAIVTKDTSVETLKLRATKTQNYKNEYISTNLKVIWCLI